ncbi:MAG: hypothetical protein N2505_05890 [Endomicrobia bacterium]|nr:hypothetical protein [Endomicrobiia bacterium]
MAKVTDLKNLLESKASTIKSKVDTYISLKAKIAELEKELEPIAEFLKNNCEIGKEYIGSDGSVVTVQERVTPIINPVLVYKKLKDNIVNVVTVNKKDLQKFLPEKEIDKMISDYRSSKVIIIKK